MKFIAENIAKKIVIALIVLMTIFAGIYVSPSFKAKAIYQVKKYPIKIATDKEINKLKPKQIDRNSVYMEVMDIIIDNKKGDGHLLRMPNIGVNCYGIIEKGCKLKKGDKVRSLFIHDFMNFNDTYESPVVRFDYLKVKNKKKKWEWKMVRVISWNNEEDKND